MRLLRLAAAAVALAARADAQTDCTRPDDTAGYVVTETELSVDVGFDVAAACATGYEGTGAAAACATSGLPKQHCVMRWFFNHSALEPGDAIINGASTVAQLGANLDSLDAESGPLPSELVAEIDGSWEEHCASGPQEIFDSFPAQSVAKL